MTEMLYVGENNCQYCGKVITSRYKFNPFTYPYATKKCSRIMCTVWVKWKKFYKPKAKAKALANWILEMTKTNLLLIVGLVLFQMFTIAKFKQDVKNCKARLSAWQPVGGD